jgi:uncharacterized protein (UPF0264 family)
MSHRRAELLVSVRSAAEADAALVGGAHLIDVKEPLHGSLGRAADSMIAEVIEHVARRRPVSAAMGELTNPAEAPPYPRPGLAYAKWGLFGMGAVAGWRARLTQAHQRVVDATPDCRLVTVAYADWQWAGAPLLEDVVAFVCERPGGVLLVDTFQKAPQPATGTPPTLLELLPPGEITALCRRCRAAGVRVALAGSLGAPQIRALRRAGPDWFAVRGAVCEGRRESAVSAARVRELVSLLEGGPA